MKKILLAGAMLMPVFSFAAPSDPISIRSYGQPDCGEWTQQNSNSNKAWLLGFLSGLNMNYPVNQNALARLSSANQAISWMDNYCKANPLRGVLEGGFLLMEELKPRKEKK